MFWKTEAEPVSTAQAFYIKGTPLASPGIIKRLVPAATPDAQTQMMMMMMVMMFMLMMIIIIH